MNIFHLEELKIDLLSNLAAEKAPIRQIELLNAFFDKVLEAEDSNILEVFLVEFTSRYTSSVSNFIVFGLDPKFAEGIINSAKNIWLKENALPCPPVIKQEFKRIDAEIKLINVSLNGEIIHQDEEVLSFPIVIKQNGKIEDFGQIEKFNIKIHKDSSLTENKFLVVPSIERNDSRFEEQLKISWDIALNYLKIYYKRPNTYHEIVLIFNHRFADIEGYSLGFAITLGFIQALFKFYNTSLNLILNRNVTFTGGFNSDKTIKSIGKDIIAKKIDTVFFSPYNYFALPDSDLIPAKERLNQLLIKYPNKKLKIISIQDFDDLINHRKIIRIEKAKFVNRTKKYVKKNSIVIALLATIFLIIGFSFIYNIDNNPSGFKISSQDVHIVNKHGKILWSTKQPFDSGLDIIHDAPYVHRIYDIDQDGINEVLLANEVTDMLDSTKNRKIWCYDNSGDVIWNYLFIDSVATNSETFDLRQYYSEILDIIEVDKKPILLAIANHLYFPSAIYKLDLKTGKRLSGTLWSQGHFNRGVVGDFDNDGEIEIFTGGINNGLESSFILLIDYNNLNGQTPSVANYMFNEKPQSVFKEFILLNKTDISRFLNLRFNNITGTYFDTSSGEFVVGTSEGKIKQQLGVVYRFDSGFDKVQFQIGDDFQFIRDSLVIKGLINGPLTTDPKFSKELLKGIQEWDGEKFVKFNAN